MGFEACHPAVNFIFFAAAIYGAVSFKHPVFLAIAYVCAFVYSIKRCGKRAVMRLCLIALLPRHQNGRRTLMILHRLFPAAVQNCSFSWAM